MEAGICVGVGSCGGVGLSHLPATAVAAPARAWSMNSWRVISMSCAISCPAEDQDAADVVDDLPLGRIGGAVNECVFARRRLAGVFAGGRDGKVVAQGLAAVDREADRAALLRHPGGIDHAAVNPAHVRGGRLLRRQGDDGGARAGRQGREARQTEMRKRSAGLMQWIVE